MDKEFVPYEPSLALKELGFDEPCLAWFSETKKLQIAPETYKKWTGKPCNNSNIIKVFNVDCISAPTFSQAFRWFREKHDWQHSIEPTADQHSHQLGYNYWIWNYKTGEEYHTMPKNRPSGDWEYKSYEEAELACLIKLIEIVKNK